jgi:outer membrane protein assembly factor BamB
MKLRLVAFVLAVAALLAGVGYVAWHAEPDRSAYRLPAVPGADDGADGPATGSEDGAEIERAGRAALESAPPPAGGEWPQWRGPSRTGAVAGGVRTDWERRPPEEVWRVPIGGGYGSCAVAAGRVYVQDRRDDRERVVCLDAASGRLLWAHAYPAGAAGTDGTFAVGPRATPAVSGGRVFAVGGTGKCLALEAGGAAARVCWEHDLLAEFGGRMTNWGVAGSPLVHGDRVVVQSGGTDGAVVAFDGATGVVKWKAGSNPPSYCSPVAARVGGRDTLFALLADELLAIRPADGAVTGRFPWASINIATPLVVADYVFVSSAYGTGSALARAERSGDGVKLVKVYQRRRGYQNHFSTSVYRDKHLFGIDGQTGGGGLKCVALATGQPVADWGERDIGQASLILAGAHLIVQTAAGDVCLVAADPRAYRMLGRVKKVLGGKNNWATPALADGRLYLRGEEHVVCLDVRP